MNRRYAYQDHEILVAAQPAQAGWRPEVCVIAPDRQWQFVPIADSFVANDPVYAVEVGRRFGETAIEELRIDDLVASYDGLWH